MTNILICLQLETAKEEISTLKKKCEDCEQEITRLKSDLQRLSGDYGRVATRSRIVSITLSSCWWFYQLSESFAYRIQEILCRTAHSKRPIGSSVAKW